MTTKTEFFLLETKVSEELIYMQDKTISLINAYKYYNKYCYHF